MSASPLGPAFLGYFARMICGGQPYRCFPYRSAEQLRAFFAGMGVEQEFAEPLRYFTTREVLDRLNAGAEVPLRGLAAGVSAEACSPLGGNGSPRRGLPPRLASGKPDRGTPGASGARTVAGDGLPPAPLPRLIEALVAEDAFPTSKRKLRPEALALLNRHLGPCGLEVMEDGGRPCLRTTR